MNKVSFMKAGWQLCNNRSDLWVDVIRAKYKCGNDIIPQIDKKRNGSNFRRGLCRNWDQVSNNITLVDPAQINAEEKVVWKLNSDGMFSNASSHASLTNQQFVMNMNVFPVIWRAKILERLRCFLWRIVRGAILTNVERMRRGLTFDPTCPICNVDIESSLHIFRDCQFVMKLWQQLLGCKNLNSFIQGNIVEWIETNVLDKLCEWRIKFVVTLDCVWKARNMIIF